ncbi:MAG: hypothetical protein WCZ87_07350, partial [Thiohalobacteraceae bacterium]
MSDFSTASQEDRVSLTRSVIGLLESWGIGATEQIAILALPSEFSPRNMRRFQMDTPFPDDPEIMERIEHLIGIA